MSQNPCKKASMVLCARFLDSFNCQLDTALSHLTGTAELPSSDWRVGVSLREQRGC